MQAPVRAHYMAAICGNNYLVYVWESQVTVNDTRANGLQVQPAG